MYEIVKIDIVARISKIQGNPSIDQVAKDLGTTRQTLKNWEKGKALKSIRLLEKFALLCGCTVDELLIRKPKTNGNT